MKRENPRSQFAGMLNFGRGGPQGKEKWTIELPKFDLATIHSESIIGRAPQANVVYFPPENRTISNVEANSVRLLNLQDYSWATSYTSDVDPDSLLLTIKASDPAKYKWCLDLINSGLSHRSKRILPVRATERHSIEVKVEPLPAIHHPLDALSSGEKQILLLVGFTVCMLQEGGIVIVDEPDLHVHISLLRQLLDMLAAVVREKKGQFIVAAHSQLVWNWFSRKAEQVELSPWRGEKL
ncbi:MAG TPA: AAA family ATPase [Planctomycetaceae bacterium]